jgi:hypothetical protein
MLVTTVKKITVVDDSYICFSVSCQPYLCNDPATFRDMDRGDVMTNTGGSSFSSIFGPWKATHKTRSYHLSLVKGNWL